MKCKRLTSSSIKDADFGYILTFLSTENQPASIHFDHSPAVCSKSCAKQNECAPTGNRGKISPRLLSRRCVGQNEGARGWPMIRPLTRYRLRFGFCKGG